MKKEKKLRDIIEEGAYLSEKVYSDNYEATAQSYEQSVSVFYKCLNNDTQLDHCVAGLTLDLLREGIHPSQFSPKW